MRESQPKEKGKEKTHEARERGEEAKTYSFCQKKKNPDFISNV
jgi:hypothetical protein